MEPKTESHICHTLTRDTFSRMMSILPGTAVKKVDVVDVLDFVVCDPCFFFPFFFRCECCAAEAVDAAAAVVVDCR